MQELSFSGHEERQSVKLTLPDGDRFVVVSDAQVPFEDKPLLKSIFDDFVPWFSRSRDTHLFLAGDILDNYSLSKFPPRVLSNFSLKDEIDLTQQYLAKWVKRFDSTNYVFGNHEDRWDRELYGNNAQFAPFTQGLADALKLDELGIEWLPYLRHFDVNGFVITHGDTVTVNTAAKMLSTYKSSGCSGHVNRPHSYTEADARSGNPDTWYVLGHTCRPDIGDYIKDWRKIMPWQQGFGVGEISDGRVHFQLVRVQGGQYYAAGRVFTI